MDVVLLTAVNAPFQAVRMSYLDATANHRCTRYKESAMHKDRENEHEYENALNASA